MMADQQKQEAVSSGNPPPESQAVNSDNFIGAEYRRFTYSFLCIFLISAICCAGKHKG